MAALDAASSLGASVVAGARGTMANGQLDMLHADEASRSSSIGSTLVMPYQLPT